MTWLRGIFIALMVLAAAQILYYYPQMSEVLASHFDGSGIPNGWAGKSGFFALYGFILLLLAIVFLYVPVWSTNHASFGKNLPHREYWLAPQHKAQTKLFFSRQMLIMGIAHQVLAIYTVQLVIRANFDAEPQLDDNIYWVLLAYFIFMVGWLIRFFVRFRKPA